MRRVAWGSATALLLVLGGLVGMALAASTTFTEPVTSPETVSVGPSGVTAADLDGDGDVDLATVSFPLSEVTILRNNGNGNFSEGASGRIDVGTGGANAITSADVDGDGDVDLATTEQTPDELTILKNKGNATFSVPASSPELVDAEPAFNSNPADLVAGDFDGDDDQDFAVALAHEDPVRGNVAVLRNSGGGNLTLASSSPERAETKPVAITAARLDGDDDVDLAVANQQSGSMSVLGNNGSANFTVQPQEFTFGSFPQAIVAARLNGDDQIDLAVANQGDDKVSTFRNAGNLDFSLFAASPEQVGDTPLDIGAADFDLDGDQDLATANRGTNTVSILRNNAAANFTTLSPPPPTGAFPSDLALSDFDGDGDIDIAVANSNSSTLTILRNN